MFNNSTTESPQIFLRPHESVHIPFKYQTFYADHSVPEQTPTLNQQTTTIKRLDGVQDNRLQPRSIKV